MVAVRCLPKRFQRTPQEGEAQGDHGSPVEGAGEQGTQTFIPHLADEEPKLHKHRERIPLSLAKVIFPRSDREVSGKAGTSRGKPPNRPS